MCLILQLLRLVYSPRSDCLCCAKCKMIPPRGVYKKRKLKGNQHTIKLMGLGPET